MPLATSTDHGHNLQTVQLLIKKNQVMCYGFIFTTVQEETQTREVFDQRFIQTDLENDVKL